MTGIRSLLESIFMTGNDVGRSPFRIRHNTLPQSHLGQWLSEELKLIFRVKPAYDDDRVMVEVCPLLIVLDAATRAEKFKFQTETMFQFSGKHSSFYIQSLTYQIICLGVDEFNEALQQTKSLLAIGRTLTKPTFKEMEPPIIQALTANYEARAGVRPHWKKTPALHAENNEEILKKLPAVPSCKQFVDNVTAERLAMTRCFTDPVSSEQDLRILSEATHYYHLCFAHLDKIDLFTLTKEQAEKLKVYLNSVFTVTPFLENDLTVNEIYRATVVQESFLENGKVRDRRFLSYPPLRVVQNRGIYNRCSSPDNTLFYACERENVAIREIKAPIGNRIILSTWQNHSGLALHYHPLCLAPGIANDTSDKATYAFEQLYDKQHPILLEWMQTIFSFITKEFIKESDPIHPQRYDYFFSAFFSDRNLQPFPQGTTAKNVDCIAYPSVAWDHIPTNLAILPEVIDTRFMLLKATEFEVTDTWYDKPIALHEYPAKLRIIRESTAINNGRISWNDD